MRIPINKDLEEEYKDQLFAGYSTMETVWIVVAAAMVIGAAVLAYNLLSLPLETCAYVGIPFGIPAIFIGFKKFQGLTVFEYLRELVYENRTRLLLYDADELPEKQHVFSMKKERKKKGESDGTNGKIFRGR